MPSSACIRPDDDAASSVAADTRMMQQAQPKSAATRADATTVRSSSRPIRRVGTLLSTSYAGVPLRDMQEAASHADPRTTMRYDRARTSLDRHATYIVAAYVAGAARQAPETFASALASSGQGGSMPPKRNHHGAREPPFSALVPYRRDSVAAAPNGMF